MARYLLVDENGIPSDPLEAATDDEAVAEAREWMDDWAKDVQADLRTSDEPSTRWIQARLVEDGEDGRQREITELRRRIEPEAATVCPDGREHEWVGEADLRRLTGLGEVGPSGGSVWIRQVCGRCGTEVVQDDWCQCAAYVCPGDPHEHTYVRVGKYREELEEQTGGGE